MEGGVQCLLWQVTVEFMIKYNITSLHCIYLPVGWRRARNSSMSCRTSLLRTKPRRRCAFLATQSLLHQKATIFLATQSPDQKATIFLATQSLLHQKATIFLTTLSTDQKVAASTSAQWLLHTIYPQQRKFTNMIIIIQNWNFSHTNYFLCSPSVAPQFPYYMVGIDGTELPLPTPPE